MSEEELIKSMPSAATLMVRGNEVLLHCKDMTDEEIEGLVWPTEHWQDLRVTEQVSADACTRTHQGSQTPHALIFTAH